MKKTKLTRSLLAACSIVALSAVAYGCSSGISQGEADKQAEEAAAAAAAAAKAAAEEAARKAAEEAAEQAEKDKQAALEAQKKAARADAQKQVIMDAAAAAGTAVDAVGIGASDADITAAETAIAAVTTAIEAAVDVDDTSMYTAQVTSLDTRLMTAKSLVMQERADRKDERAASQQGAIDDAISDAQDAVALVVEGASNEVIEAAEAAVQDARDAIAAADDVDDTSEAEEAVDGIAGDLMDAKDTVLADRLQDRIDMQQGAIDAAIKKAQSAAAKVILGASDDDIAAAETAVKLAEDAIAAAEDVEDTSGDTATVAGIKSGLATAKTLVIADRAAKKAARAENQKSTITSAITAANTAIEELALTSSDDDIAAADMKVKAITAAITAAVDVSEDEKAAYTAQVGNIQASLMTSKTLILSNRTIRAGEETAAIEGLIDDAADALAAVDADADADDETAAADAIKAVDDAIAAAVYADTTDLETSAGDLDDELEGRKAIRAAIAKAKTAVAGVDADASADDVSDAEDAVDAVEEAINAAMHLTDEEKAAFMAVVDDEDTGLDDMLAAAKTQRSTDIAAADKEDKARAQGLGNALEAAEATDSNDGTFNDAAGSNLFNTGTNAGDGVTATHDGSKVTLTVTETTNAARGTITKQDAGPAGISGWTGQKFTRGAATDDTVGHFTVYTDIDAPASKAWSVANVRAALGLTSDPTLSGTGNRTLADLTGTFDFITWGSTAKPTIVKGDTNEDGDFTDVGDTRSFDGYLAGAMGSYKCTIASGDACGITFTAEDKIATLSGGWDFISNSGAKVNVPDTAYLHFGWWIDRPTKASDGSYSYGFQSFEGGTTPFDVGSNSLNTVEGTATYNGAAAGVYVMEDISGGQVTDASMGEFTASAKLSADFGADDQPGAINGSISNFKGADGSAMAGWGVTLKNVFLAGDSATFAGTTEGTTGPGATGGGSWEGTFYGTRLNPDTTNTNRDAYQPTDVAGRFDAHLPGTSIAGAFGASRQ